MDQSKKKVFRYEQKNGILSLLTGNASRFICVGYSGRGDGLNNPEWQNRVADEDHMNDGPIPKGTWRIGPQADRTKFTMAMTLTPLTYKGPRSAFLIHGPHENDKFDSSAGCIVIGREFRNQIEAERKNGIDILDVV